MSKIAKIPIPIIEGTSVAFANSEVKVVGPKGTVTFNVPKGVDLEIREKEVKVLQKDGSDTAKELAGLLRATVANMITGVTRGFEKKLELSGVGYRAQAAGNLLTLSVGFSHPVKITADQSILFGVEENIITVSGMDKTLVGDIAAKIRMIRPPEPYKGKGIKYQGERIRRKVGKAAKTVGATK